MDRFFPEILEVREAATQEVSLQKVFSTAFRLALKMRNSDTIVWIEVSSLDGLRSVMRRLGPDGDLSELEDRFAGVELQLWGLLAEHCGFLRRKREANFQAGILPLGGGTAALVGDMASLFGGEIEALEALDDMRRKLRFEAQGRLQESDKVKYMEDGLLTLAGEEKISSLVSEISLGHRKTPITDKCMEEDGLLTPAGELALDSLIEDTVPEISNDEDVQRFARPPLPQDRTQQDTKPSAEPTEPPSSDSAGSTGD